MQLTVKFLRWRNCPANATNPSGYASHQAISYTIKIFRNYSQMKLQYDCTGALFEFDGKPYSWWNDKNGNARYFWSGNNSSAHTCQCGIDGACHDLTVKCNCDGFSPTQMTDNGIMQKRSINFILIYQKFIKNNLYTILLQES